MWKCQRELPLNLCNDMERVSTLHRNEKQNIHVRKKLKENSYKVNRYPENNLHEEQRYFDLSMRLFEEVVDSLYLLGN